jgi:putative phage-type endonuclease
MTSIQFPTARFMGLFEDRDEWLKIRATGVGGSEVATICGLNKWESAYTLWCKKTNRIETPDLSDREPIEWGNRLEPVIIDKFADEHPELTVFRDVGTYQHVDRPWQRANPDAVYRNNDNGQYGVLEIKTAQFEDDWMQGVPRYYYTQVQWYLQTLGLGEATVAVLFHGNKYREYQVLANQLEQDVNLERVLLFCEHLEHDTPPALDDSESTHTTLREQHPNINPDESVELGDLGYEYLQRDQESKKSYVKLLLVKNRILDAMGDAKTATLEGKPILIRSSRGKDGTPYLQAKKGTVD